MTETVKEKDELYLRQSILLPMDIIQAGKATVIGVGAIGRQVALQLCSLGVGTLQLIDPDVVDLHNLPNQGYWPINIGSPKVDCLALDLAHMRRSAVPFTVEPIQARYKKGMETHPWVFICVDSIDTRRFLWESLKNRCSFYCDGRMSAETLRVITASDEQPDFQTFYPTTLFAQAEAHTGTCARQSTIYCANLCAGLMVSAFTQYLRHMPYGQDVIMNLLSWELAAEKYS